VSATASSLLPDDALVVRGGTNTPEQVRNGIDRHRASGIVGVSVQSAAGLNAEELAVGLPHGRVGVTTVGRVRAMGGDVVPTSGRSPHHATLTGLTPEQISGLLNPTVPNPALGTGEK
jgi:hypothetical protein